jgi:hypothetical protein
MRSAHHRVAFSLFLYLAVDCVLGDTVWKSFDGLGSDTSQKVRSFRSSWNALGGPAGGATGHSEATGAS